MARIRLFIVFVLAISAGGAFAFATYRFVQRAPDQAAGPATRGVVVAAVDLNIGAELKSEDLKVVEWPLSAQPQGAFATPQELVGRGVIQTIVMNEPILPTKLAGVGQGAGLPPVIPEGMRALSVRVNDVVGVAGYVLPGTRVDVVATVNPTQQTTSVTSKVIMTNVQVLAAGTKIEQDVDGNKPIAVSVVTLLVNPSEAERLTLASTEGKIQLALRNPTDMTAPPTPGIRPAALMGSAPVPRTGVARPRPAPVTAAAQPAPAPPPLPSVEIIRGDKRAQEVVQQD